MRFQPKDLAAAISASIPNATGEIYRWNLDGQRRRNSPLDAKRTTFRVCGVCFCPKECVGMYVLFIYYIYSNSNPFFTYLLYIMTVIEGNDV